MAQSPHARVRALQPPDALFSLVVGVYVAAILGPVAVALARRLVTGAAPMYGVLLVSATGGIAIGAIAVRGREGTAERLGDTALAWLLVAVPLVGTAAVLGIEATRVDVVGGQDVFLALFGGFGAAFVGFVLVSMAKTRYAAWLLEGAMVEAAWAAPWPRRSRRRTWYAAGFAVGLGVIAFLAGAFLGLDVVRIVGQLLIPAGAVLATVGRELTYRATDRGLEVRAPVVRRIVPWAAFEGYRLSAEVLSIERPEWYRQSIRCDRSSIDDHEAVAAALDAHLERLS